MRREKGQEVVTPQLLQLLELLSRYKYLRTSFIRQLLDVGQQGIIRQLQLRRDQGYIFKPREQLRAYNSLYSPRIHSITKKGEQLLARYGREPEKVTRLHRAKGDAPVKNFAHAMMICDATASIEIGCKQHDLGFIPWTSIVERVDHPDPMRLEFATSYQGKTVKGKIVPDGLFGIRYPNDQVSFFALEAEHFSPVEPKDLNRSSTLRKLLAYHAIIGKKSYQQLGIPNLRVLFVYPTKARAQHASELATRLFKTSNAFLFHDVPVQEELLKAPPPFPELLTGKWKRAGMEATPLYKQ